MKLSEQNWSFWLKVALLLAVLFVVIWLQRSLGSGENSKNLLQLLFGQASPS